LYKRNETRQVKIGKLALGGNDRVLIQSMTNTKTKDIEATLKQINALEKAGSELVRLAVLDLEDARAIKKIKESTNLPLVADIHFDHRLALEAINSGIDKIRINPGNIGDETKIKAVVEMCKSHLIPIRIGINSGSLEKQILAEFGHASPEAMVRSAAYHVSLLEKFGFSDIVLSLKATSMLDTIRANRLAAERFPYPLHLGITEAGTSFSGTIRSAAGLGVLLDEGIGSTIRVSLTADPLMEIKVAKEILANFGLYEKPTLISCPTCGRIQYDMIEVANEIELFLEGITKNIKVAVMGCVVNGPGEARDANIAIFGGNNEAMLYIDGVFKKKLKPLEIIPALKAEILAYSKD
jgi:(E)-4-hydroxy-3-methylbut-2-enyl-diphosphate synthase